METETLEAIGNQAAQCRRRSLTILFVFGFWSLIIIGRLTQIMVIQRDRYLAEMTRTSWYQGTIPALRGRILTVNGIPLAWSTRTIALRWHVPEPPEEALDEWRLINRLTKVDAHWDAAKALRFAGRTIIVCRDLSPAAFTSLEDARKDHPALELMAYFVRHRHPTLSVQQRLGNVVQADGMEVGISGAEHDNDSLLRGRPGLYRVMLNPDGSWKTETWEQIRDMQPGYDVYLPIKIDE